MEQSLEFEKPGDVEQSLELRGQGVGAVIRV